MFVHLLKIGKVFLAGHVSFLCATGALKGECADVPQTSERRSYTFMTFNIWGDYFGNPVGERETGIEQVVLKEMPDIVSFQEVTPNWWKSPLFANLEKAGYAIVRGDEKKALERAACGGTKSTVHVNHEPLLYRRDLFERLDSGTDFFHPTLDITKSVTWAVLADKKEGRRFVVFGTHFWWQRNGKESDTLRQLNARHILFLLENIRRKWDAGLPALLGGDLNAVENAPAHAMLRNGGFVNAASHADVRSPCRSHHGNPRRGADGKYRGSRRPATEDLAALSIDHIYYTKGIHGLRHRICMDQEALDVSDHSPVLLTFALD